MLGAIGRATVDRRMSERRVAIRLTVWPLVLYLSVFAYKLILFGFSPLLRSFASHLHASVLLRIAVEDLSLLAILILVDLATSRRARFAGTAIAIFSCSLYLLDTLLVHALATRLTIPALVRYADELRAIGSFVSLPGWLSVAAVVIIVWLLRRWRLELRRRIAVSILVLSALAVSPWLLFPRTLDPILVFGSLNLLRLNLGIVLNHVPARAMEERWQELDPELTAGIETQHRGVDLDEPLGGDLPDILIIVSESLSQVDSQRSGGLFDRLPLIDRIQADGTTLTQVVADGANTTDALAALLLGIQPLPAGEAHGNALRRFPAMAYGGTNLVAKARQAGYRTGVLTAAPLSFEHNGEWLASMGFDVVIGAESPALRGEPRFAFGGLADRSLYRLVVEQLGQPRRQPLLLVVLTLSLHRPYLLPERHFERSGDPLLDQLAYVDATTAELYSELRESGFFDRGLLLLVGDHRRMAALEPEEASRRQLDAYGRVLACLVGDGVHAGVIDDTLLNQSDLNRYLRLVVRGGHRQLLTLDQIHRYHGLGLPRAFASHVIAEDLGLVLIRFPERAPHAVRLHGRLGPGAISDAELRAVTGYLTLSSAALGRAQRGVGRSR